MIYGGVVSVYFTGILQGYFTGTGAILWLPQCWWSNTEGYGCLDHVNPLRAQLNHNKTKNNIIIFICYGIYSLLFRWGKQKACQLLPLLVSSYFRILLSLAKLLPMPPEFRKLVICISNYKNQVTTKWCIRIYKSFPLSYDQFYLICLLYLIIFAIIFCYFFNYFWKIHIALGWLLHVSV